MPGRERTLSPSTASKARTRVHWSKPETAALVLVCLFASCDTSPPRQRLPDGHWRVLGTNPEVVVAIDTAAIFAEPDSSYRVRILYRFADEIVLDSVRNARARVLVTDEISDCGKQTSYVTSAIVHDTLGATLGKIDKQSSSGPTSMIGAAGPALCSFIERWKIARNARPAA